MQGKPKATWQIEANLAKARAEGETLRRGYRGLQEVRDDGLGFGERERSMAVGAGGGGGGG